MKQSNAFVTVGPTRFSRERGRTVIGVDIRVGDRAFPIELSVDASIPSPPNWGDVWLPLALVPAMSSGYPIRLENSPSQRMIDGAQHIQSVLSTWFTDLQPVVIESRRPPRGRAARPTVMQFFTGGVDSFYTLLSLAQKPSALAYVHGFDVELDAQDQRQRVAELLQSVSREHAVPLIQFTSNARSLLDEYGDWGSHTHGAALASVAHLASGAFGRAVIPATHTYLELDPWASHPLIDFRWSTSALEIDHHGAGAGRFEKTTVVAESPIALRHLRVCWRTRDSVNCSVCEKCLRTMASLELLGKLDVASTFSSTLDLSLMKDTVIRNRSELAFVEDNLRAAKALGREDIVEVLTAQVRSFARGPDDERE